MGRTKKHNTGRIIGILVLLVVLITVGLFVGKYFTNEDFSHYVNRRFTVTGKLNVNNEVQKDNCVNVSCDFGGFERTCTIYLPKTAGDTVPVIYMLHGYGGSADAFSNDVHMEQNACERGYAVVYVSGSANHGDSTSSAGWNYGINDYGVDDVEFLEALAGTLSERYSFDTERTYIAGFSNGAIMTYRMMVEAGATFKAFVSVAGTMSNYVWKEMPYYHLKNINLLQINGTHDDLTVKSTYKYTKAGQSSIDSLISELTENGLYYMVYNSEGENASIKQYEASEGLGTIWHVQYDGYHAWPQKICPVYYDSQKSLSDDMVITNELILDYLDSLTQ